MENKRMKEQMEKQAEEEKKKKLEEDKIMGSESVLIIAGEDIPSFSLDLSQMTQEIQRDRASEEEIQEHTPPQKQPSKEAVLETSKGTIERGVKERKRAERDRDDSDFVYPKQKKKKNENPLPQPAAASSTAGFGDKEISSTSRELTETTSYRILQPHQQDLIKKFFDKSYSE